MVVTDRDDWAMLIRALCNQGRAPGDTWLEHTHLGYNYRLDEMSAALGRVQMNRLEELLDRRSQVAGWYNDRLSEIPGIELLPVHPHTSRMSWFVFVIRLATDVNRYTVVEKLAEHGVPTRPYFTPIHLQPYFVERFGFEPGDFPITEDLGRRSLALPFSGIMREDEVERVCQTLRRVLLEA